MRTSIRLTPPFAFADCVPEQPDHELVSVVRSREEPDSAEKLTEWASEHGVVCLPDHESVPDADFLAFSCLYDRILDRNELADAAERARCSYILRPGFERLGDRSRGKRAESAAS